MDAKTVDFLLQNSGFNDQESKDFKTTLDAQLKFDNHDIALEEKMEIITTCFDKNIHSVII
jgi:hypothetical protein